MNPKNPRGELKLLLRLVEESYARKAWHGPNLRRSLRGVTPEEAAWRPNPDRHNIWEIVVHCAYWKYVVRRRLLGERRGSFPSMGSNWFKRPVVFTARAFSQEIALLEDTHRSMVEAIRALGPKELTKSSGKRKTTPETLIRGIALHDVYHAGQIQLLKKLMK